MEQSDEGAQYALIRDEAELAQEVRVTLLERVKKAAEEGDGPTAHQLACAYEALARRQPDEGHCHPVSSQRNEPHVTADSEEFQSELEDLSHVADQYLHPS